MRSVRCASFAEGLLFSNLFRSDAPRKVAGPGANSYAIYTVEGTVEPGRTRTLSRAAVSAHLAASFYLGVPGSLVVLAAGSSTVSAASPATSFKTCTIPLGHRTVTAVARAAMPRPKCARLSLDER